MKNIHIKIIVSLLLILPTSSSWCTTNIDTYNKKIIDNFRKKHITENHSNQIFDEHFINDKRKVKKELLRMANLDQSVRIDVWDKIAKRCHKKNLDCSNDLNQAGFLSMDIDKNNLQTLKLFMQKYPWFKISEFGKDGAEAAWLIVQHAMDDIELQTKVLFIIEQLVKIDEADAQSYALLHDRVSLNYQEFGLKQRYGSQFRLSDDKKQLIFEPCEGSIIEIDARRKELGLMSVAENAKLLSQGSFVSEVIGLD